MNIVMYIFLKIKVNAPLLPCYLCPVCSLELWEEIRNRSSPRVVSSGSILVNTASLFNTVLDTEAGTVFVSILHRGKPRQREVKNGYSVEGQARV